MALPPETFDANGIIDSGYDLTRGFVDAPRPIRDTSEAIIEVCGKITALTEDIKSRFDAMCNRIEKLLHAAAGSDTP